MQAKVSFHPFFFSFSLVAWILLMSRLHHNSFSKYTHKYTVHTVIGGGAWIQWERGREGEQKTHTHAHTKRQRGVLQQQQQQQQRQTRSTNGTRGRDNTESTNEKAAVHFVSTRGRQKRKLRPAVSLQQLGEDGIENPTTIKGALRHCYPPCLTFKSFSRFLVTSAISCLLLLQ